MRFKSKIKSSGFSLIEVLVAVVVFALVAKMAYETTGTSQRHIVHTESHTLASWVAYDRIAEIRAMTRLHDALPNSALANMEHESFGNIFMSKVSLTKATRYLNRIEVGVYKKGETTPTFTTTGFIANYGAR